MKMDLIQCTVKLNQKGNTELTEVIRSGPSAITPAEARVLIFQHRIPEDDESICIGDVVKVGEVERSKAEELARLRATYGTKVIELLFPHGASLPYEIKHLDLPKSAMGAPLRTAKQILLSKLEAMEVPVPEGNLSIEDLQALYDEQERIRTGAAKPAAVTA